MISNSLKRAGEGKMRYLLAEIPSQGAAQDAGRSLTDYEDFVYRADFLDLPDPVGAWRALREQQQRACDYLVKKSILHFRAPARDEHEGTDLTVDVSGRRWSNHAGKENMPDGEVESGPRSADGVVNFSFPVTYRGKRMEGIRLRFRDGRVVEASAEKGEDYLISLLDQDEGARGIGEIAIGTNYELKESVSNVMFDEKIGGTFHLAVGAGFPETGSTNVSALHMDMVCDLRAGGTIHADGELVQKDGVFVFDGWPGR